MKINGKVHCFFEQSGTFKNEFKKLGIPAEDYDIQNNFGQTDHVTDLFKAIEDAYDGKPSLFDAVTKDDLIIAFFPCIYFCEASNMSLRDNAHCYAGKDLKEVYDCIIRHHAHRHEFFSLLNKIVFISKDRKLRLIIENPRIGSYLNLCFLKPALIDNNRMKRGDYFVKPTQYWFINCEPTHWMSFQNDKERHIVDFRSAKRRRENKTLIEASSAKGRGICSEERSMISPDYARNFICDFILGKPSGTVPQQTDLFDALGAED